jgi:hypothetical protein
VPIGILCAKHPFLPFVLKRIIAKLLPKMELANRSFFSGEKPGQVLSAFTNCQA